VLGAYLRLYRIRDYLTFLGDEGRDVLVVKKIITGEKFTLLGPTASVGGFFLGPIYYYFMIPFLWAWQLDPVGPAIMVALFGIATIYLVFLTGKDFFDAKAGLIAALLYSISPVVITYSRASWNPNIVPFFSLLIIYLTKKIVVEDKWKLIFWLGLCFGIAFQLHYLVSFLAIAVVIYFLLTSGFKKYKHYLLGIAGFLLGISPFFLFEVRKGFPNTISLFKFLTAGKEVGGERINFLSHPIDILGRLFTRLISNNNAYLGIFLLLISLTVFIYCLKIKSKQKPIFQTHLLLICWGIIGIFLFGFYNKAVYDYYLGFLFPLPFLLTGHAFSHLSKNLFLKILTISFILYLFLLNWSARPFNFEPNKQLQQTENISRFVLEKTGGKPFNFALITGQNSDHAYRYFFEIWGKKPVTIENPQLDPERKTVTSQLLIICEKMDCAPLGNSLWEVAGFGRAEIAGEWDLKVVKVFRLVPYKVVEK